MENLFLEIVLFAIFGIAIGMISGFFGIGGGSFVSPLMLAFGYDIKTAIGISIMQMVFSSVFGSVVNYKAGKLKINDGLSVGIGGLVGAFFSGFIVKNIPSIYLEIGLTFALFICILKFFVTIENGKNEINSRFLLFVIGFLIGMFAISMGIGGAMFLTPILVGFMGYDLKKAVSMGLFFVIFSSISGLISMMINGFVNYKYGFLLGIGSLVGVYFGVKMSHMVEKNLQKKLLLVLYLVMFILMVKQIFFN
ncbi:sulfite exporter TauE/SafE family protein [Campylobacter sp. FMV-PI01]|uniref:Probable membrane transporter protein n=1 Tax=Campylobacter portucalensis TaxID=2608384 RepID=A0A6L5WI15_9BACT|nr:sulfite exporter TauE/SafE family protein [Campylobacter portucalensis]MSN96840.1 sulfite exporter TauE/SafE family protein [Campylobacter portucalensis]